MQCSSETIKNTKKLKSSMIKTKRNVSAWDTKEAFQSPEMLSKQLRNLWT